MSKPLFFADIDAVFEDGADNEDQLTTIANRYSLTWEIISKAQQDVVIRFFGDEMNVNQIERDWSEGDVA